MESTRPGRAGRVKRVAFGGHKARQDDGNVSRGMGRRLERRRAERKREDQRDGAGSARVLGACNLTITNAINDAGRDFLLLSPRRRRHRGGIPECRGWNKSSSAPFVASHCVDLNNESGAERTRRRGIRIDRCIRRMSPIRLSSHRRGFDRSRENAARRRSPIEIFTLGRALTGRTLHGEEGDSGPR